MVCTYVVVKLIISYSGVDRFHNFIQIACLPMTLNIQVAYVHDDHAVVNLSSQWKLTCWYIKCMADKKHHVVLLIPLYNMVLA